MLVIGLTGPSGAGKSVVAKIFAAFDLPVIDADRVYHELLVPPSPCLDALTERFGVGILNTDGTLNRRTLGQTVFADPDALSSLRKIDASSKSGGMSGYGVIEMFITQNI